MANLIIAPATGDQGTTQNPQTVPTGETVGGASTQSGSVQPGTAKSILTSQNGESLSPSALTTVSLDAPAITQSQTISPAGTAKPQPHHFNPALFAVSIALVLIAAGFFWAINRSAKTTTD